MKKLKLIHNALEDHPRCTVSLASERSAYIGSTPPSQPMKPNDSALEKSCLLHSACSFDSDIFKTTCQICPRLSAPTRRSLTSAPACQQAFKSLKSRLYAAPDWEDSLILFIPSHGLNMTTQRSLTSLAQRVGHPSFNSGSQAYSNSLQSLDMLESWFLVTSARKFLLS